jgi:hypothetical protein
MSFSGAGDFNGDGFFDVALVAPLATTQTQMTFSIYFGAAAFADKAPDLMTAGPSSAPYAAFDTATNVGDLNGDAFADVALFHGALGTRQTLVRIFLGGRSPDVAGDTDVSIEGDSAAPLDASGDVNGDGYDDLVLSQHGVLPGGPTAPSSFVPLAGVGPVLLSGFDINGDGNADVLLSIQPGQIILGGPTPMTMGGLNALTETLRNRQSTWADYNGDGRTDFALGDSWLGQVWLILNDGTLNPAATGPIPGPAVSPFALTGAIAVGGH